MTDFANRLPPDLKVLDVGSLDVNGSFKDLFDKHEYVGCDISEGKNVDVVQTDPMVLPFADETFDVVISGNCVEHVDDIFCWVKELGRVLKRNGLICITTPHTIHYHPYPKDYWRIRKDGMLYLFREGYEIIECEEFRIDTVFRGRKL